MDLQDPRFVWTFGDQIVDWAELSDLYRVAPLGDKNAADLELAFSNSMFKCFVYHGDALIGAGRALSDGVDCSYLCDVAVHPAFQGIGVGKAIVSKLKEMCSSHKKILLYANPGREGFYEKLGFKRMRTAMASFRNQQHAISCGLVDER